MATRPATRRWRPGWGADPWQSAVPGARDHRGTGAVGCAAGGVPDCERLRGVSAASGPRWKHGSYSAEVESEFRRFQAEWTAFNAVQATRYRSLLADLQLLLKRDRAELRNAHRRRRHSSES